MKWLLFFFGIILPGIVFSQNKIHGTISENTTWSGVIILDGDVTISRGVTLTIEPGSRILCAAGTDKSSGGIDPERVEVIVLGTLIANGTGSDGQIVFTSNAPDPQMNDWYGIVIKNLKTPSVLNHTVVEYAYKGITCYGSSPNIDGCEIRFNYYIGISSEVRAQPHIRNTIILGNGFAGISCELAASSVIENTVITQNSNGVIVFDRSRVDLGHVPINPGESRGENRIFNNFEVDIYNRSTNDIFAQNNIWNVTNPVDVQDKIFDQNDNPTYGKVIIEPVYVQGSPPLAIQTSPPPQSPATPATSPATQPENQGSQGNQAPSQGNIATTPPGTPATTNSPPERRPTTNTTESSPPLAVNSNAVVPAERETPPPQNSPESSNARENNTLNPPTTSNSTPQPGTSQIGAQENTTVSPSQPPPPPPQRDPGQTSVTPQQTREPIIEALLDSGRRRYVNRARPKYPEIYQRTHHEGKVLMEVIVNEKGEVDSYRVLSSDGEYFTIAAIDAIKQMRYKPETFRGKPVKFKIVEPFIFKLK